MGGGLNPTRATLGCSPVFTDVDIIIAIEIIYKVYLNICMQMVGMPTLRG